MSAIPDSKAGPFPIKAILACAAYTNTDNETAKQRAIFLGIIFGKLALRCIVFAAAA